MIAFAQTSSAGVYTWRFRFHDALTGAFIDDLPLEDVEFEWDIPPQLGDFTGYLRLGDDRVQRKAWRTATAVRRTVIHVECNDVLLPGAWMLWNTNYDPRTATLEIHGTELWSYYARRLVDTDRNFAQVEQLDIFRTLFADAADIELGSPPMIGIGNLRVQVDPAATTGVLRDRTYTAAEGKALNSMLEELSNVIDGFDFVLEGATDSNGNVFRRIRFGYPRLGTDSMQSGIVFSAPGNITSFSWPQDGSSSYNLRAALGDNTTREDAIDDAQLQTGVPLLEHSISYSGISDAATLSGHAAADLAVSKNPAAIPAITVRSDALPYLGGYGVGDNVLVQIEDPAYFPNPLQSFDGADHRINSAFRVVGIHVRPDTESVTLTLNDTNVVADRIAAAQQAVTS